MSNAFASGHHSQLDETVNMHVANDIDVPLAMQRYRESRICLPTAEGPPLRLQPGEGGAMGGPFMVSLFR
eukprot:9503459-Pyramimonas_sp.AAC.1